MIEGISRSVISSTAAVMAVVFFVPGLGQARVDDGIQLKFWGGAGYHFPANLNDGLRGWNDGLEADPYAHIREGGFEPIHWGFEAGGELIVKLGPCLGIGIGTGFLGAGRESTRTVEYGEHGMSVETDVDRLRIKARAIPIRLSGHWDFPSSSRIVWSVSAGIGYYFGALVWNYQAGDYRDDWTGTSGALGVHGGIAVEVRFSKALALVVEAGGLSVRFKNLEGDLHRGGDSMGNATLWSFEGGSFPFLEVSAEKPMGAAGETVTKTVLDLSGVSARLGFKVTL